MATFEAGAPGYAEACERAEEQIRADLKAGTVSDYIDGESAQEYLGDLIRLNSSPRDIGESVGEWIDRIGCDLDSFIQNIINQAVEDNVARVAQENSK